MVFLSPSYREIRTWERGNSRRGHSLRNDNDKKWDVHPLDWPDTGRAWWADDGARSGRVERVCKGQTTVANWHATLARRKANRI
jgi:hypothetical protein